MRDAGRLDRTHLLELHLRTQAVEEPCPAAKDERDDVQLHVVDEPGCQVLVDDAGAAAYQDVPPGRCRARLLHSADSIPPVTNVNVVSESVSGSRA